MQDTNLGTYGMGGRIAAIRKAKGWTQAQLAEKMDVSIQAESKWETGASWPDVTTLPRLAQVLGVSIDWLFGQDTEDPNPEEVFRPEPVAVEPEEPVKPEDPEEPEAPEEPQEPAPEDEPREEEATASLELHLNGVVAVEVRVGTTNRWTWEMKGDRQLQEAVEIRTEGQHLKLVDRTSLKSNNFFGLRNLFSSDQELQVILEAPAAVLEDAHIRKRGSAKLTIEPTVLQLDLESRGVGDIRLQQVAGGQLSSWGVGDLIIQELDSCVITSGGVGDLTIDLITGRLDVKHTGVGDIRLKRGYLEDLQLKKSGVGDFRASEVEVMSCDLDVRGVGDVHLGKVHEVRRQHTGGIASIKFN